MEWRGVGQGEPCKSSEPYVCKGNGGLAKGGGTASPKAEGRSAVVSSTEQGDELDQA